MARMVRTNVVLDEDLVERVMRTFGLESRRSAIDFALHAVLGEPEERITDPWKAALELEGLWADMTDEEARAIWGDEVPDGPNAERPERRPSRRPKRRTERGNEAR
jgi:Arc/MetJ family transcription regulator